MAQQPRKRKNKGLSKHQKPNQIIAHSRLGVRVAHHQHTGRKIPLRYTSYVILFFILALTGLVILFASIQVHADQQASGSIQLSGTVPGPPPTQAAVITSPVNGQHFTNSLITVSGTCAADLFIDVYRFGIQAGSTLCNENGTFSLTITLVPGNNDLMARSSDSFGRYAPDSNVVNVVYDAPAVPVIPGSRSTGRPFLLYLAPLQRGVSANVVLKISYDISGGNPPYAAAIAWGDNTPPEVVSLDKEGNYQASHTYKSTGTHIVSITATDLVHRQAYIESTVIVNGTVPASTITRGCEQASTNTSCLLPSSLTNFIQKIWPAFIITCLMTLSFWFGERIVFWRYKHNHKLFAK